MGMNGDRERCLRYCGDRDLERDLDRLRERDFVEGELGSRNTQHL